MRKKRFRSKRVTAKEVAEKLGISAMTVSRALNDHPYVDEETRKKVEQVAKRMGYSPDHIAKSLATRKTHTIGVVLPEITHSFFPEAIRGIEEVTYQRGYHLILTHSAEDAEREKDAIRTLESKRVDGILISTAQTMEDYRIYNQLVKSGVQLVFFDRCVWGIGASCVSIDDEESAKQITEHLIGHGYKRIAHLNGPQRVSIGKARLRGYRRAIEGNGLTYREEMVIESGFHEGGGYEAMNRLLDLSPTRRPRAVVAINDPAAFGAMKAIAERGLRIPQDIAIVGFSDDIRSDLMPTPLTTVRQPAYELGKRAAQQLLAQIEGKSKPPTQSVVKADLVIRQSCGCNPP
jgi:DNA-binding LacI/PurR family transcriptional regulator